MDVREVRELPENVEHQYIAEDSKTRLSLPVVRKFDGQEYAKPYSREERAKLRKRIIFAAETAEFVISAMAGAALYGRLSEALSWQRGSCGVGSEVLFAGFAAAGLYILLNRIIGGRK